jgi:hypothetical protein
MQLQQSDAFQHCISLSHIIRLTMMITGYGDFTSTVASQESARKCYDAYALANRVCKFSETKRDVICSRIFFQKFAYRLTSVYRTKQNTPLKCGSVIGYIGCIMSIGQTQMFRGDHRFMTFSYRILCR